MNPNPESPFVELVEAFETALPDTARRLEHLKRRRVESDLKRELRASLDERLGECALEPTEHRLDLAGWQPRVGGVDLAIAVPEDLPALVELKWGAGTLYNCAWDAVKLALALAEGATRVGYMVAGAPASEWSSGVAGAELFGASEDWSTAAFMERHRSGFAQWRRDVKTRPQRLPDGFRSDPHKSVSLQIDGAEWQLRWAEVALASTHGWVEIDDEGHASAVRA